MNNNNLEFEEWEELILKIRTWDRREHNWAVTNEKVETHNLQTKESFIKSLMKDFYLERKVK